MRRTVALLSLLALPALADPITQVRRILPRLRERLAADGGRLWKQRLDEVPLLFVDGERVLATAAPGLPGFVVSDGLWSGALPREIAPANTSLEWAGRHWAMVLLPLPDHDDEALRLLIHETWHVVQPTVLPLPSFDDTAGSAPLEGAIGRRWLQLEWRALASALTADPKLQEEKVRHALMFRRQRAAPDEKKREQLLDLTEGLAEYTAWKLSNGTPAELAGRLLREAPTRPTFVRSFPYFTGPAYAILLDARAPGWIARLRQTPDLQALLLATVAPIDAVEAEEVAKQYGGDELRTQETQRERRRQEELAELRRRFVDGATLRLRPKVVSITFDPRNQTSLGDQGTVMANLVWKAAGGAELRAPSGALVTVGWQELRVPLDDARLSPGRLKQPLHLTQRGWTLTLPAGWELKPEAGSWIATP